MNKFAAQLQWGQKGEKLIAEYLCGRHKLAVMPVYDVQIQSGKGPQVFTADASYAAPDALLFNSQVARWVECKQKTSFTWHRNTQRFTTGIDANHFQDYLKVKEISPWPLWLMFLQGEGEAKDTPQGKVAPSGLYGGEIDYLKDNVNHTHANWGRHGMVYWAEETLHKIDSLKNMGKQIRMHRKGKQNLEPNDGPFMEDVA